MKIKLFYLFIITLAKSAASASLPPGLEKTLKPANSKTSTASKSKKTTKKKKEPKKSKSLKTSTKVKKSKKSNGLTYSPTSTPSNGSTDSPTSTPSNGSTDSPTSTPWISPVYGGSVGTEWDDFEEGNGRITKIIVRHGWWMDSIEACYKVSGCKKNGGDGGVQSTFELNDDEHVIKISGTFRFYSYVYTMQFFLNTGRVSPIFGGEKGEGSDDFTIKKDGMVVSHFFGYSDEYLNQIGAVFIALP